MYYQKYWIKCDEYYNMIKLQTEKQTQANIIFCKNKNFHCMYIVSSGKNSKYPSSSGSYSSGSNLGTREYSYSCMYSSMFGFYMFQFVPITKYNHAFLKERTISLLHIFLILVMHKTRVTSKEYMCLKIDIFTPRHDNVTNTQWNTSATKTHMTSLNGFQTKTPGITWLNLSKSYRILTYQTAWLL